jgi:hypothetical protein
MTRKKSDYESWLEGREYGIKLCIEILQKLLEKPSEKGDGSK